ncbi:MAG: hypothetical protein IPM40_00265 [Gammaproteobacteria bacterium]|nr:hypothetical protein [Gammaproteobacteria bacterium]
MDLYLAARHELAGHGAAIEFGAFLGASTAAIQAGLRKNTKPAVRDAALHVVDCFKTPINSAFAAHVRQFALSGHIDDLLSEDSGWLCFYDAFTANVRTDDPKLFVHQCFVQDFRWTSVPVELLHIDLPKDWAQASIIVGTIFPDLVRGARIILQDFAYQWSAELIALVGHLCKMGQMMPYRVRATTLSCILDSPVSMQSIQELQERMSGASGVIAGIDLARDYCRGITTTKEDLILRMAKAQYLKACARSSECNQEIAEILDAMTGRDDFELRGRLAELFHYDFVLPIST